MVILFCKGWSEVGSIVREVHCELGGERCCYMYVTTLFTDNIPDWRGVHVFMVNNVQSVVTYMLVT